jgi:hypothetical protein
MKAILRKIGKAIWKALPWAFLTIWLACIFLLPILHANERAELTNRISALEAENAMYESVNARLVEDIEWLRSLAVQDTEVTP